MKYSINSAVGSKIKHPSGGNQDPSFTTPNSNGAIHLRGGGDTDSDSEIEIISVTPARPRQQNTFRGQGNGMQQGPRRTSVRQHVNGHHQMTVIDLLNSDDDEDERSARFMSPNDTVLTTARRRPTAVTTGPTASRTRTVSSGTPSSAGTTTSRGTPSSARASTSRGTPGSAPRSLTYSSPEMRPQRLIFGRMGNNQHFHNGDGEQGYGTPTDRPAYSDEEWGDTSRASSRQGSRNSRTPGQFGGRTQFPWSMADGPGFGSGCGTQGEPTHGINSK